MANGRVHPGNAQSADWSLHWIPEPALGLEPLKTSMSSEYSSCPSPKEAGCPAAVTGLRKQHFPTQGTEKEEKSQL